MARFSAGTVIAAGFRLIGRHPGAVLAWGLAYVAVALAPLIAIFWNDLPILIGLYLKIMQSLMAGVAPPVDDPELVRAQGLLVAFEFTQLGLNLLAVALVSCAVYRAVLEPERKAFAFLRVGQQELWVLVSMLAFALLLFLVLIAGSSVAGLVGQAVGTGTWTGGLVLFLASCGALALVIWMGLRLSPALPMSFAERRFRLMEAWPLTQGEGWRLFGVALCLVSIILFIQMVLAILGQALGLNLPIGGVDGLRTFLSDPAANLTRVGPSLVGLLLMQILTSALSFTVWAAPFAEIYGELKSARPPAPKPAA